MVNRMEDYIICYEYVLYYLIYIYIMGAGKLAVCLHGLVSSRGI
jgi:hypothetical protein